MPTVFPTHTRVELRQEIGRILDEVTVGTADSGSTTTLVDTDLIDSIESGELYQGAWVWMAETAAALAWSERRVSVYAPTAGSLAFSRAWPAARAEGMSYEIHRLVRASKINELINRMLARLTYETVVELTLVDGQRNYNLSDIVVDDPIIPTKTFLTLPQQVMEVYLRSGDTVDQYAHYPTDWWNITEREGQVYMDVPAYGQSNSEMLGVRLWRFYSELSSETDTTTCPKEWLMAGVMMLVYEHLMRHGPAQDTERWKRQLLSESQVFRQFCRQYTPRLNNRTHLPYGRS